MTPFKPFFNFIIYSITHLDKEAFSRLSEHKGKIIGFEFINLSKTLYFKILDNNIEYIEKIDNQNDNPQIVNTVISGQLIDFIKIWTNQSQSINTKIHIHGDMALAEALHHALKDLDFDWEEKLSYVLGDTLAVQLTEVAKSSHAWTKNFFKNRAADLTEFLQFEKKCLPSQIEINDFCNDVDTLRNDVERLASRVERLKI